MKQFLADFDGASVVSAVGHVGVEFYDVFRVLGPRQIAVPDVVGTPRPLALQHDELRLPGMAGCEGVGSELTEPFGEKHMIGRAQILVTEEQHFVAEEQLFEFTDQLAPTVRVGDVVGERRSGQVQRPTHDELRGSDRAHRARCGAETYEQTPPPQAVERNVYGVFSDAVVDNSPAPLVSSRTFATTSSVEELMTCMQPFANACSTFASSLKRPAMPRYFTISARLLQPP